MTEREGLIRQLCCSVCNAGRNIWEEDKSVVFFELGKAVVIARALDNKEAKSHA